MATTHALKNPAKKKKKKKHIGLRIFLILIIVLLVVPLIFVSTVLITWKSGKDISNVKDANINEIVEDKFFGALDRVKDDQKITFQLKENDLDILLKNATKKINQPDYIPQIYCNINGNNFDFGIDVQFKFIKTNVILQTTLGSDATNDDILFKLNRIKLGYCPIPDFLYKIIINKVISDQKLNEVFEGFGLNLKFNLENKEIRYPKEKFINDISKLINKQSNDDTNLMSIMMSLIKNKNVSSLIFDGGIGASINLNSSDSNYKLNDTPFNRNKTRTTQLEFEKVQDNVLKIMNNPKNNNLTKEDADTLFNYFSNGYNVSYKNILEKVQSWDNTPIKTLSKYEDYEGSTYIEAAKNAEKDSKTSMFGKFENEIGVFIKNTDFASIAKSAIERQEQSVEIDAPSVDLLLLRQFCATQNIVGYGKPIVRKNNDKYDIKYIGLKDFDFQIDNNNLYILATISINGYDIYVTISTTPQTENINNNLFLKFNDIYFGKIKSDDIDANLKDKIINLIYSKISTTLPYFSFQKDGIIIKTKDIITKFTTTIIYNLFYNTDGISISTSFGNFKVKGTFEPKAKDANTLGLKSVLKWNKI